MKETINRKWSMITKINREIDDIYHQLTLHYGLSESSFWILYILYENKKTCNQSEICNYWYCSKQTINSAIKNLENLGYIYKGYEENGKVNKKIGLTELGKEIAEKTIKPIIEIEEKAFSVISENELDTLIELFQKPLKTFKEETNKILHNKELN